MTGETTKGVTFVVKGCELALEYRLGQEMRLLLRVPLLVRAPLTTD